MGVGMGVGVGVGVGVEVGVKVGVKVGPWGRGDAPLTLRSMAKRSAISFPHAARPSLPVSTRMKCEWCGSSAAPSAELELRSAV